jgi:AraC-like DNA-binding protein
MECLFGRGKSSTDFCSDKAIYINNCGYFRGVDKDVETNRPHGRADYHLLVNAVGSMTVNGEVLTAGDAYLILPWESQRYVYKKSDPSLYYWLHFSGSRMPEILAHLSLRQGKYSLAESKGEAQEILGRMVSTVSNEWEGSDEYLAGQFYSLLSLLCSPRRRHEPFAKAVRLLKDPASRVSVAELAGMYQMSEEHFIRQFKAYIGQTPLGYRTSARMETARSLLLGTDLSVTDIACALGYDDPLYFSRVFKKSTGLSPRAYRARFG